MTFRIAFALGAAVLTALPALAQDAEPEPEAVEEPAPPRPRRAKPRAPAPATSVAVANATAKAVTALALTGDGDTETLPRALPPKGRATMPLPKRSGCTIAIQATLEGGGFVNIPAFDVCKERTIRFTE